MLFLKFQGKVYVYDKVFKANATQESVYNTAAKPIVKGMWLEFNCLRNNAKALNDLYTAGSCKKSISLDLKKLIINVLFQLKLC